MSRLLLLMRVRGVLLLVTLLIQVADRGLVSMIDGHFFDKYTSSFVTSPIIEL